MSLYNLLFGKNPHTSVILALLDLKENDVERFRNCSMSKNGISIYTRTGGNNRGDYPNELLTNNKCYLRDEDDNIDNTYATFYFKFPDDIKDDCLKLSNIKENGIPSSIIKKVHCILSRPETNNDKWANINNQQYKVYSSLCYHLDVYETNGHTIVPLSDDAMERLLRVAEANDYLGREGEFLPFRIMPYKLHFEYEVPKYSFKIDQDKLCRIKISLGDGWKIDKDIWARYKDKFELKYPTAIGKIQVNVDKFGT